MATQKDNAASNAASAGNDDLSAQTREELEAELRAARARKDTLENESSSHTERTTTTTKTDLVKNQGRVGMFFSNMGKTTVAVGGVVAGALLGVGGTVLYHKRATRTAVGSIGNDTPEVTIETPNM